MTSGSIASQQHHFYSRYAFKYVKKTDSYLRLDVGDDEGVGLSGIMTCELSGTVLFFCFRVGFKFTVLHLKVWSVQGGSLLDLTPTSPQRTSV